MKKIRVLIVEDSLVVRILLEHIIGSDPRLEIAASVGSAEAMLEVVDRVAPDVISLDIRLPGMNGLDATLELMARRPTPIVVIAADVNAEDRNIAMNALRAGALTVIEKPVGIGHEAYAAVARHLCDQLVLMSRVKVVRQNLRRGLTFGTLPPPAKPKAPAEMPQHGPASILAIVASTGGPNALVQFLNELGPDFPLPVLLVQHMLGSFLTGFTDWLAGVTPFGVRVANDGDVPRPGVLHVSPPDRHLLLAGDRLKIPNEPPLGNHRPSGTLLLRSVARSAGPSGIGVVLTGMGNDGAEGLLELRQAGGYTLAEDESTAVVYGMPGAAQRLGAVEMLLPLPQIAPAVLSIVARSRKGATG